MRNHDADTGWFEPATGLSRYQGQSLRSWLMFDRDCDEAAIKRITNMHRWRYGSYRPSYLQDSIPLPGDDAAQQRENVAA